ncbi:MAG: PAS domain-containing protein [Sideroxydans sp.]|nr:PAS domain-containing protein [Sideroxydans sp.]
MRDNLLSPAWERLRSRTYVAPTQEALWQSIYYFNLYRLILGGMFVFLSGTFGSSLSLGARNLALFYNISFIYVLFALASQLAIRLRKPRFAFQLSFQVGTDIVCVTLLSHASGGIQSSLGMLLLVSLAAAGLISRGRITLFFAALASIAVLLEHSYSVLAEEAEVAQYLHAGLLSVAYFAVAWVAHTLAKYAVASEKLAAQRGVDLANMAEANRLVIQGMLDGVLVVDERGVVRQFNPSAERLLGYQFPVAGGVTLERCAPLLAGLFAVWRQDRGRGAEVVQFPASGGQARVSFLPVQREGFWGALVFLEDMRRIQAQAQQIKLAALGRLTANIAHEVRNPLSAISYATELLHEEKPDPAHERLVRIILDNTARLNRIVQDVMQLNRRDRAQAELLRLDYVLPRLVSEVCEAEHVDAGIFNLNIEANCEVEFDRGHFDQVLWNLCGNALRYCQKRAGSVQLRVSSADSHAVMLEISDDGSGVALAAEPQLFEPFFTTEASGTGLGLYIARELCEANGAMLEYVRRTLGGACFRIVFGGRIGD